jgi:hypothetical protein
MRDVSAGLAAALPNVNAVKLNNAAKPSNGPRVPLNIMWSSLRTNVPMKARRRLWRIAAAIVAAPRFNRVLCATLARNRSRRFCKRLNRRMILFVEADQMVASAGLRNETQRRRKRSLRRVNARLRERGIVSTACRF